MGGVGKAGGCGGGWDGMWGDEVIRRKERKGKRWGR